MSASESPLPNEHRPIRRWHWYHVPLVLLGLFGLLVLPGILAQAIWILQMFYHLAVGWFLHISSLFPKLVAQLQNSVSGVVFAILIGGFLLAGIHRLIIWWREYNGCQRPWRKFHSFLIALMILLGSGAAIALSGVAHELAWLPKEPFIESNRRHETIAALSDARQLGLVVLQYEAEHGTFPVRWSDLEDFSEYIDRLIHVRTSPTGPTEQFLLLPSRGDDPQRPIIVSPIFPRSGKFLVVAADSSVRSHEALY